MIWEMMAGITARADCLGPKVLNGRTSSRQTVGTVVADSQLIGGDLGRRVGRQAPTRGWRSSKGTYLRGAVVLAGGGDDHVLDAALLADSRNVVVPSTFVRI
jgi:hypothetical protein